VSAAEIVVDREIELHEKGAFVVSTADVKTAKIRHSMPQSSGSAACWAALVSSLCACSLARDTERFSAGGSEDGGAGQTGCVTQISAKVSTTCALRSDGKPYCWGDNFYGQLGDGSKTQRDEPVEVQGFVGGVKQISVGGQHTCAVKDDGSLWCWGRNAYGQLGTGDTLGQTKLVRVPLDGVSRVSAGFNHTCVVRTDGTTWCWGLNGNAQLGGTASGCTTCDADGSSSPCCPSPIQVSGAGAPIDITSGSGNCAWEPSGKLICWGLFSATTPTEVPGVTGGVAQASYAGWYASARSTNSRVWVWGAYAGEFLTLPKSLQQDNVPELTHLAAGDYHLCVATQDGVWCWGENCEGQRGDGSAESCMTGYGNWNEQPTRATNLAGKVDEVAAGYGHTCARTVGGVWCWGASSSGQLGRKPTRVPLPVDVPCPASADAGP
jgi:alpha-tubulin suppressor-like RCC1 family protein